MEFSNQNALIISRFDESLLKTVLFVRSCVPLIHEFVALLEKGLPGNIGYSLFNNVLHVMEMVMNHLFDIELGKKLHYEDLRDDPIPYRQKIFKDFRLLEAFTDIIYLCKNYMVQPPERTASGTMFWIETLSSRILS